LIAFDIETGPLDEEIVLARSNPFEHPDPPGEFDESSVKLGRMKDPEKIAAKIADERERHKQAVANYEADRAKAEAAWKVEAISKAALSPLTGQVLAIGYKSEKGYASQVVGSNRTEADLLAHFWKRYKACRSSGRYMSGHNIHGFDLPFLVRRSWMLDVSVPDTVISKDRFWDDRVFKDTKKVWGCGKNDWAGLDNLSVCFGGPSKPEGVHGGMFSDLFKGTKEERRQALEYLENDLEMTYFVAQKLGIA